MLKCPHCSIAFHDAWESEFIRDGGSAFSSKEPWGTGSWQLFRCKCPSCRRAIFKLRQLNGQQPIFDKQIFPSGSSRSPTPAAVPRNIAGDYEEACNVLAISPKASAALSRRCLQNMLHANGYKDRDLAKEIDLLLNESDRSKAIPTKLRTTIDAIRNFGNFSAHPIDDKTSLQIIDVDPEEAEWCLEVVEEMFDHFYVGPAEAAAKKAALDAKLAAAGKPPSK